jgi:two-component system, NtrC family, sensor histidine kinase GlrK
MMHWLRPKSLSTLLIIGLAMIALPFGAVIFRAAVQFRALAAYGQRIVVDGVAAARASQDLFGGISALERTAESYEVSPDDTHLNSYLEKNAALTQAIDQLRPTAAADVRQTLEELGLRQQRIRAFMKATQPGLERQSELSVRFGELTPLVQQIADQSNAQIRRERDELNEQTVRAREELYRWALGIVPPVAGALVFLTLFVGRPLRQVDRAIRELGEGHFSQPISVPSRLAVDIHRLGRQLEWLRQRLLETAQGRNRFLRHMSHELKTPLANIVQGTELLMDGSVGELDAGQREVITILRDNGTKLQRMIENLLSYSAWQHSKVGLETSEFPLKMVVKQVLENHQITIVSRRVRLDLHIEDVPLVADRSKLRLILDNLVSNAIKYSPKGGTIHLGARKAEGRLVLDVADNGPGIPVEDRAHIFDAFYTGRAARNSGIKGTGIGLSVVMEFVSAHRGQIEIIDGEYPGAHFRITMPINTGVGEGVTASEQKARAHAA